VGRPVHHSVVYRALPRQGWRKITPRPKHPNANEEAREAFKKRPELVQEPVAAQNAPSGPGLPRRVLLQEEAGFGRISDARRCWAPTGVRPEVSTPVGREYD
jgi:Winged helix-turn helix